MMNEILERELKRQANLLESELVKIKTLLDDCKESDRISKIFIAQRNISDIGLLFGCEYSIQDDVGNIYQKFQFAFHFNL